MESTYGIGEMARATGLRVSALRFYDRHGVLVPAFVDPRSGYRRYAPDQVLTGRLVARLRRVGLPLAEVGRVLAHRDDPATVRAVLAAHLGRLESGLALARDELSAVLTELALETEMPADQTHQTDQTDQTHQTDQLPAVTVRAADLLAALRAVRFAVGADHDLPALTGVLLDVTGDSLRVVATDRYRIAVSTVEITSSARGAAGAALVPATFVDDVAAACATHTGAVVMSCVDAESADNGAGRSTEVPVGVRVRVGIGDRVLTTTPLAAEFPRWQLLVDPATPRRVSLNVTDVRAGLLAAPTAVRPRPATGTNPDDLPVTCAFRVSGDELNWLEPDATGAGADAVGVDRQFLLEALEALGAERLVLGIDSPRTPLALSSPERPGTLSLLMPVRLEV